MSKFLNADDTVDLIKSGVGALDDKILTESNLADTNSYFIIQTTSDNATVTITFDSTRPTINWGDGTTDINTTHTYEKAGYYKIKMIPRGNAYLNTDNSSNSACISGADLYYVKLWSGGNSGLNLKKYAFYRVNSLKKIYLYRESISPYFIPDGCFYNCGHLENIIYINNTTYQYLTIAGQGVFDSCYNLKLSTNRIGFRNSTASLGSSAVLLFDNNEVFIFGSSMYALFSDTINLNMFNNTNIKYIHIMPTNMSLSTTPTSFPSDCIVYVPKGYLETYRTKQYWSTIANQIFEEPIEQYRAIESKLSTTGGALTGDVTTTNTTFTNTSLVTKQYVDDTIAALNGNSISY